LASCGNPDGCDGCSAECMDSCSSTCTSTCANTCSTSCADTCKGSSAIGCSDCSSSCQGGCDTSCTNSSTLDIKKEDVSSATGTIDGYDYVDLGLSVKWARYNIGATKPESVGDFLEFTEGCTKSTYQFNNITGMMNSEGYTRGKSIAGSRFDQSTKKWSVRWKTPTKKQFDELYKNCDRSNYTLNGKTGVLFTSKINQRSIFIPNSGYYDYPSVKYRDFAYLWTSMRYTDEMVLLWDGTSPSMASSKAPIRPIYDGTSGNSGCSGSSCSSNCSNNSMNNTCSSCGNGCSSGCKTTCSGSCINGCNTLCGGQCKYSCGGSCSYVSAGTKCTSCANTCSTYCYSSCTMACSSSCMSCCIYSSK